MIEITFLGTSSMMPTKERAPSSVFLNYQGVGVLFDCGEGTQRQMNIAGINRHAVKIICISHWHADHVAGLIGFLQTLNNREGGSSVLIIGPKESKQRLDMLNAATYFDNRLDIEVREVDNEDVALCYETADFEIHACNLIHRTPVIGFRFVEKDKRRIDVAKKNALGMPDSPLLQQLTAGQPVEFNGKTVTPDEVTYVQEGRIVAYVTDTLFCGGAENLARDADLLICESTYGDEHEEKAAEYKHMTSRQAACIASAANAKELILTHFSQRYGSVQELVNQAKETFPEVRAAHDFLNTKL